MSRRKRTLRKENPFGNDLPEEALTKMMTEGLLKGLLDSPQMTDVFPKKSHEDHKDLYRKRLSESELGKQFFTEVKQKGFFKIDKNQMDNASYSDLEDVGILDFCGEQGFNDFVLLQLNDIAYKIQNVHTLDLSGCLHMTDMGSFYLARLLLLLPHLKEVNLSGCIQLTDTAVSILGNAWLQHDIEIHMLATAVGFVPQHISRSQLRFHFQGCPLLCIRDYGEREEDVSYVAGNIVICPQKGCDTSLLQLLKDRTVHQRNSVEYTNTWSLNGCHLTVLNVSQDHPSFHFMPQAVSAAIIPVDLKESKEEIKKHIISTVNFFLSKEIPNVEEHAQMPWPYFYNFHVFGANLNTSTGILRFYSNKEWKETFSGLLARQEFRHDLRVLELEYLGQEQTSFTSVFLVQLGDSFSHLQMDPEVAYTFSNPLRNGDRICIELASELSTKYIPLNSSVKFVFKKNGETVHSETVTYSRELYPAMMSHDPGSVWRICRYWRTDPTSDVHHSGVMMNAIVDEDGVISSGGQATSLWRSLNSVSSTYNVLKVEVLETDAEVVPIWIGIQASVPIDLNENFDEAFTVFGYDGMIHKHGCETIAAEKETNSPCLIKGDVFEMRVDGIVNDENLNEMNITVLKNGVQIHRSHIERASESGMHPHDVFSVLLHGKQQIQILNYKPQSNPNDISGCSTKFVMKGRTENMSLENSVLSSQNDPGKFIGCHSLTKHHNQYRCRVVSEVSLRTAIGLCHENYAAVLGHHTGSVAWHVRENRVHVEDEGGTLLGIEKVGDSDVIGCGFETSGVLFRQNGIPKSNQNLTVFFTRNGYEVFRQNMWYVGGGLFPAIACQPHTQIQLLDTYPQKTDEHSTHFIVVGLGDCGQGQLQSAIQEIKEEMLLIDQSDLCKKDNADAVDTFCSQLSLLNNMRYICNVKRLVESWDDRVASVDLNPTKPQDVNALMTCVNEVQFQTYQLIPKILEKFEHVEKCATEKLMNVADLLMSSDLNISMHQCLRLLQEKHKWNHMILSREGHMAFVVTDVGWFLDVVRQLHDSPPAQSDWSAPCLQIGTPVWRSSDMDNLLSGVTQGEKDMLLKMLQSHFVIMRLSCHRRKKSDPNYVYVLPSHLKDYTTDHPADVWESSSSVLVSKAVYRIAAILMPHVIHAVLALCARFCSPLKLWKHGISFYQGPVQVCIQVQLHQDPHICLQARSYIPPGVDRCRQDVQQCLWSVFGIYADIIDYVIVTTNVLVTDVQFTNAPKIRRSVCSKHSWHHNTADLQDKDRTAWSVCTVCHSCSDRGLLCEHQGLRGNRPGVCGCNTQFTACTHCGVCMSCANLLWHIKSVIQPNCDNLVKYIGKEIMSLYRPDVCLCDQIDVIITKDNVNMSLLLTSAEDERTLTVYPGAPCIGKKNVIELQEKGDKITVQFVDLKVPSTGLAVKSAPLLYNFHQCISAQLWQNTGILHGNKNSEFDQGICTSKNLITAQHNYFEIEILQLGSPGSISIGFVCSNFDHSKLSSEEGLMFSYPPLGSQPDITLNKNLKKHVAGDQLGCGVDLQSQNGRATLYFTLNGSNVQSQEIKMPEKGLRAAVWLSPGDMLRLLDKGVWRPFDDVSNELLKETEEQFSSEDTYEDDIIKMSPKEVLCFARDQQPIKEFSRFVLKSYMYIENIYATPVIFKVKVNNPKRYTVKPNSSYLNSKERKLVHIGLQGDTSDDISRDKFMIQYGAVKDMDANFEEIPKSEVRNVKLVCGWIEGTGVHIHREVTKHLPQVYEGPPPEPSYCLAVLLNEQVISLSWVPKVSWVVNPASQQNSSTDTENQILVIAPKLPELKESLSEENGDVTKTSSDCSDPVLGSMFTRQLTQQRFMSQKVKFLRDHMRQQPLPHRFYEFSFLPVDLTVDSLLCPDLTMLCDVSTLGAHLLCIPPCLTYKLPSGTIVGHVGHIVDQKLMQFTSCMTPADIFNSQRLAKSYAALNASQVKLPIYSNILTNVNDEVPRFVIESSLQVIMGIYASLYCIISLHNGGIDNMDMGVTQYQKWVSEYKASEHERKHGEVIQDALCQTHYSMFSGSSSSQRENHETSEIHLHEPYSDVVLIYQSNHKLERFPENFAENFSGSEILKLNEAEELKELPTDLNVMQDLKVLHIQPSNSLTRLPETMFACQKLEEMIIHSSYISQLPEDISKNTRLHHIDAHNMLLKELPPTLAGLSSLTYLDLNQNPILSLPKEFGDLKTLQVLKLSGIPWLVGEQHGVKIHTGFTTSSSVVHTSYKQIEKVIGQKDLDQLFKKCDVDMDDCLDEKEAADLNAQLYYMIPRMGLNYKEGNEFGGMPEAIFSLINLEELDLRYHDFRFVPANIRNLRRLRSLHLNHCMNLESLPGDLGKLEQLSTLSIRSCPSLRTPPPEIVNRGTAASMAYLKRLASGYTENWRTKLMLVGLGGAGKTSLLKALMSGKHKTDVLHGEEITDGIDIKTWTIKYNDTQLTYSAWDFAGQTVYYNTHQFFLSGRAVYMLLWTTRLGYEHAGLDFWLSSIKCHAPHAPVFVIGTHCDQVSKAELPTEKLIKEYPQICGFHFVSCITGQGIADLEADLFETTLRQSYMGEKVPTVYLSLEQDIIRSRKETSILPWDKVKQFGMNIGIYDETDVKRAVNFLHDLGAVQYFDNEFLRDRVVINPQWIVDVMACVVSVKNSPIMDGSFYHKDMCRVWSQNPAELHPWLLRLTEEFDLTFPVPDEPEPLNIVPCLLSESVPQFEWPIVNSDSSTRETVMVYRFSYLPAGLFNRAQVRLFQFSDGKIIWKRGSLLKKNQHLALIKQESEKELVALVQGPQPENVLFLIHEVFEGLIAESFHGVSYDFQIPCPDCVKKVGGKDPSLFEASLIREAANWNAPFLQCRKFFHTVSMPYLQVLMPPDSGNDLDLHLTQGLQHLHQLRSNLSTDVFISYCSANIPTGDQLETHVHPAQIKDDLEAAGLHCWYKDGMSDLGIHEVTLALQDSKIVIVCISNEYEKDERCRTLFLHAKEILKKECVIVLLGRGNEWQQTHMGMVIGPQEVYIAMNRKERYANKLVELKDRIHHKLQTIVRKEKNLQCFISYCWSNSSDAARKGSRSYPGSLGWVDPRNLKDFLEKQGVSCWIDIEQTGKIGLFADITEGLREAQVVVICASKEYAASQNCMMEMRFASLTLNKPIVVAVVGTGDAWEQTEIGVLLNRSRSPKVNFQEENSGAYDKLFQYVKERLGKQPGEKLHKKTKASDATVSFQEEFELAQRKFLRQVGNVASKMDTLPFPHLLALDFLQNTDDVNSRIKNESETGSRYMHEQTDPAMQDIHVAGKQPKTQNDLDSDWSMQSFCFRVLCENETGWHCSDHVIPLSAVMMKNISKLTEEVAPFLYHLYALLKHSRILLSCQHGPAGNEFMAWLKKCANLESADVARAYAALRMAVMEADSNRSMGNIDRCHLPSGKISWLCKEHQKASRISILGSDNTICSVAASLVTNEDLLMKEYMEKYEYMRQQYQTGDQSLEKKDSSQTYSRRAAKKSVAYQPYKNIEPVSVLYPGISDLKKSTSRSSHVKSQLIGQSAVNQNPDEASLTNEMQSVSDNIVKSHPSLEEQSHSKMKTKFKAAGHSAAVAGEYHRKSQACTII